MPTSSHCNTGRTCLPLSIITRENTSLAVHVVQKITIICAREITRQWALNRDANSHQQLDHLLYVFALCVHVTLTVDLLT